MKHKIKALNPLTYSSCGGSSFSGGGNGSFSGGGDSGLFCLGLGVGIFDFVGFCCFGPLILVF